MFVSIEDEKKSSPTRERACKLTTRQTSPSPSMLFSTHDPPGVYTTTTQFIFINSILGSRSQRKENSVSGYTQRDLSHLVSRFQDGAGRSELRSRGVYL